MRIQFDLAQTCFVIGCRCLRWSNRVTRVPSSPTSWSSLVEKTQVGPFKILKKLGTNRRQKVYHALQVEQQKDVALKFINVPPDVEWHKALDKLDREFNQLVRLRHPNLVRVFGAGVEEDRVFFAMELVEGESLSAILSRRGKLAPDQVVEYGRQIAEFLVFLHSQDLIHSKLTPEKILITTDHQVKITDLRLNRAKRRRWDSTRRRELDIAAYMAPEHFTEGATEKSDFYSLGVVVYELLSGTLPYPPDTMGRMTKNKMNAPVPSIATKVMNCPMWLDKIVGQMLDPDPARRPHSAKAIALAFGEIQKIDATQKAAVDQMASGFNPLTAGQDNSEAKRLLGHKETKPSSPPIYQSIWFQLVALLVVAGLIAYFAQSESHQSIVNRARAMIESDDADQWSSARDLLNGIMEGDGPIADEAEELYYQSRQKSLVARAESGKVSRVDSEYSQQFSKAFRLQIDGRDEDAADIYAWLVAQTSPDGDYRHIYRESQSRYEQLTERFQWPDSPEAFGVLLEKCAGAASEPELLAAHSKLGQLTIRFAGEPGYETVLERADELLQSVKEKLIQLNSLNRSGDESSSPPPTQ